MSVIGKIFAIAKAVGAAITFKKIIDDHGHAATVELSDKATRAELGFRRAVEYYDKFATDLGAAEKGGLQPDSIRIIDQAKSWASGEIRKVADSMTSVMRITTGAIAKKHENRESKQYTATIGIRG